MADIEMNGIESIEVVREDDELGSIVLKIEGEDGTSIKIDCGRFADDAENLMRLLSDAATDTTKMCNEWEDRPDEHDAYVSCDRGEWFVTMEGMHWNGDKLVSVTSMNNARQWKTFPSLDIATYELAAAMTASGCFPNAWEEMERGGHWNIAEKVRAFHDEGGTGLKPLEGVQYEDGDDILHDGMSAYVVKDYGTMGIVYIYSGDDTRRHAERDEVAPYVEQDEDDE